MDAGAWATWAGAGVALAGAIYTRKQASSARESLAESKKARQISIDQANSARDQAESARESVDIATDQAVSARESATAATAQTRIALESLAAQRESNHLMSAQLEAAEREREEEQVREAAAATRDDPEKALIAARKVVAHTNYIELGCHATVTVFNNSATPVRDVEVTVDPGESWRGVIESKTWSPHPLKLLKSGHQETFWLSFVFDNGETVNATPSYQLSVTYRFTDVHGERWQGGGLDTCRVSDLERNQSD